MTFFNGFVQKLLKLCVEEVFRNRRLIFRQGGINLTGPYGFHHVLSALQNFMPGVTSGLGKDVFERSGNSGFDSFFDI